MEPLWETSNMLFYLLKTSFICIMTIMRHGPLDTMLILRLNYFTTGTIMRQALLATSLLWDMPFFLQQPLWDMTILRQDHFETWHFSYSNHYETWPFWDMTFFLQQPLWDMTILRHDIFPTATIMTHDHLETWFCCYYIIWSEKKYLSTSGAPNNQRSLWWITCLLLWPFWDMITLQK